MKVDIVTLFPRLFDGFFSESMMSRAIEGGALEISLHDLRDFCEGKHKQADDYRFGGGPGMLMKPEPLFKVLTQLIESAAIRPLVIFPSPVGKPFMQSDAAELSRRRHLIFICGHYKGIDQRIIERFVDRQYSLGDYILTGGELASAVMIDASARLLPGVLGDFDSARGDSFGGNLLDAPHYTRPEEIAGMRVPGLLVKGHHVNIGHWRKGLSNFITRKVRPDLI